MVGCLALLNSFVEFDCWPKKKGESYLATRVVRFIQQPCHVDLSKKMHTTMIVGRSFLRKGKKKEKSRRSKRTSENPDLNQGPRDDRQTTVSRSTNWAIFGCYLMTARNYLSSLSFHFAVPGPRAPGYPYFCKFMPNFFWASAQPWWWATRQTEQSRTESRTA